MKNVSISLTEIKLVGMKIRTSNAQIFEQEPGSNKIATLVQRYFQGGCYEKIDNRKNPGTSFSVYTDYESDEKGEYTYFIGEEVFSFGEVLEEFDILTIPGQNYIKFTNESGPMPEVCVDMWKKIWNMSGLDLGAKRTYIADFEVYDQRSADHNNAILDIYIGIKK